MSGTVHFKLTEQEGDRAREVEVRVSLDSDHIDSLVEAFRSFLLALQFAPKAVDERLGEA